MTNFTRRLLLAGIAATTGCGAGGDAALETFADSASYAIGANIGTSLKRQAPDVHGPQLVRGVTDALAGKVAISESEVPALLQRYAQEVGEAQQRRMVEEAGVNADSGRQFLERNGKRQGVTTTASGLQYEVIKQGTGRTPKATDVVSVHYRGTLIDGTEFDANNRDQGPVTFPLNQVITGWTEGVQLMPVGSVYKLYVPGSLAYGEQGAPPDIPSNAALIFEVELVEIR